MAWLAELVDGPLAGETVRIDDDHADTPPAQIKVKGCRYRYSGWHKSSPRYQYNGEGGSNGGGRPHPHIGNRRTKKAGRAPADQPTARGGR